MSAREPLRYVLEIGSAAGGGSTEAFVKGLSLNPNSPVLFCIEVSRSRCKVHVDFVRCYNMSTVALEEFPTDESVAAFYARQDSSLKKFPLAWLQIDATPSCIIEQLCCRILDGKACPDVNIKAAINVPQCTAQDHIFTMLRI